MTTPPHQPPPHGQGFPPPHQPDGGQPSPPQGFPAQPGHQPMPGYQGQPPQHQPSQYPQPGYPQPGQGFPGPAHPPGRQVPPEPGKRLSRGAKALIAVVALGIVGIVIAAFIARESSPGATEAGDCIKINSVGVDNADVEKVECSSPEAAFTVAENLGSNNDVCPSGDYAEYSDDGGRRSDGFKLCLMLNAAEGECFKQEGTIVTGKITKVTCDSSATHKVTKAVTGSADENECESGDTVFVYSQPATTLCLSNL